MKFRGSDRARERALAVLTREAAGTPMPTLDWDRIESRLVEVCEVSPAAPPLAARPSSKPRARRAPSFATTPWPIAFAAAAAAWLVFGTAEMRDASPARDARAHLTSRRPPVGGFSSLDVGEIAETGRKPAAFNRPGPVSFSLAPNSRIEVVANDFEEGPRGGITFALSHGSIDASVTQHSDGEIFAVEVERTRIAAHGTAFRVTREADRVVVDISEGSVAIGPTGHRGSTHGWLLTAPARAAFSLDGARQATWLEAAPPMAVAVVSPPAESPSPVGTGKTRAKRSAHPTTSPRGDAATAKNENGSSAPPNATSWGEGVTVSGGDASEREAVAIAGIVRELSSCYEKQVTAFGVRFSVESSLTLTLTPSGAIREGVFAPPLSPTLMSCADKAVGAAHFPRGEAARQIRIPVRLKH